MDRSSEIRDFLTSRRARVTPEQAGVPTFAGVRRVPGLRREEVAHAAGISVDYYNRLERGKDHHRVTGDPRRDRPHPAARPDRARPPVRPVRHHPPPIRPVQPTCPAADGPPDPAAGDRRARHAGLRREPPAGHPGRQPPRPGPLHLARRGHPGAVQRGPLPVPRPPRGRLLPRLGIDGPQPGGAAAHRDRPRPRPPRTDQADRRALHPVGHDSAPCGPPTTSASTAKDRNGSTTPSSATSSSSASPWTCPTPPACSSSPTPSNPALPPPKR